MFSNTNILVLTFVLLCWASSTHFAESAKASASSSSSSSTNTKCDAAREAEMDDAVAKIMTIGTDRVFVNNVAELKEYCDEDYRLLAKLNDYRDQCLNKTAKQIVSVINYSIKSLMNSYCRKVKSKRTALLLGSTACANTATKEYGKCQDNYSERLVRTLHKKDISSKQMLKQSCCGYVEAMKCARTAAEKFPKVCTEPQIEQNIIFIRGFFDNAINTICGDYTDASDKCDKVDMPKWTGKKPLVLPKSYFSTLVKILVKM